METLKVVNKSPYKLEYATPGSAGFDIHANLGAPLLLKPLQRSLIPTGVFMAIPNGFEAMVRPRSGLTLKHGITVLNTPGTIDADYRGEVGIILINLSNKNYTIEPGDRIAQIVINQYTKVNIDLVEELNETKRGAGGFGHTGK